MRITAIEPLGIDETTFKKIQSEFAASGHTFEYHLDRREDPDTVAERIGNADIAILSNIKADSSVLTKCPNLKMLSIAFTGLDHIDLEYCRQNDIQVYNAAGYSTHAVSELAVGLMIDLYRKITHLDGTIRNGQGRGIFLGRELRNKTVGIVGTGAIGNATINLLNAFGCKIIAYSRTEREEVKKAGVTYTSLETLMTQSDIITLHLPLNEQTHHIIDAEKIAMMKTSAILINTARGNICDIDAIASALQEGRIAGAAFDVFENEPPLNPSHPLLNSPNTICTPHIAYATQEAFEIRADIVLENVRQFIEKTINKS